MIAILEGPPFGPGGSGQIPKKGEKKPATNEVSKEESKAESVN